MKLRGPFYAIVLLILLLGGCNSEGCLNNQSALPLAAFYSSSTGQQVGIRGMQIRGVGAPGDSLLLSGATAPNTVYLPMRSDRNSTEWEFILPLGDDDYVSDFITFDYTSEPHFASEECGAMYFYHIDRVEWTTQFVDSVVVTDSLITNYDMTRIKIYFHDQQQPEEDESDGENGGEDGDDSAEAVEEPEQ